ncbi:MAG: hypothetical protein H7301_02480 [Cryobacterium sp.]|nr:hypothetical protein [Oligoflexia bacterium]
MKNLSEMKESTSEALKDFVEVNQKPFEGVDYHKVTHFIEEQTGKLPWVSWVGLSTLSLVAASVLIASDRKGAGLGVGMLAPCFLLMGVYNKIAKIDAILASDTNTVHANVH